MYVCLSAAARSAPPPRFSSTVTWFQLISFSSCGLIWTALDVEMGRVGRGLVLFGLVLLGHAVYSAVQRTWTFPDNIHTGSVMFLILAHHKLFSSSDRSFLILAEEEFNGLPNDVSKSGLVSQSSLSLECVTCETEDEVCYEISIDLFMATRSCSQIQPKWNTVHS